MRGVFRIRPPLTHHKIQEIVFYYLFILLENKDMYLIPKDIIKNKATINICDKYKKFKVEI